MGSDAWWLWQLFGWGAIFYFRGGPQPPSTAGGGCTRSYLDASQFLAPACLTQQLWCVCLRRAVVVVSNLVGLALSAFFTWRARAYGLVQPTMRCHTKDQLRAAAAEAGAPDVTATASATKKMKKRASAPALNDGPALPPLAPGEGGFLLGLEFNPRLPPGRTFDVKMFLYLVGACVMQWILLAGAATEAGYRGGSLGLGMATYAALLSYFLAEYMYWEVL